MTKFQYSIILITLFLGGCSYQNELDRIGLNHQQVIELRDTTLAKTKRVILLARAAQLPKLREKTIFYKLEDESYSPRFIQLLKQYYLYL